MRAPACLTEPEKFVGQIGGYSQLRAKSREVEAELRDMAAARLSPAAATHQRRRFGSVIPSVACDFE